MFLFTLTSYNKITEKTISLIPQYPYELRIDFRVNGQEMFAEYSTFRIEDESDKYVCVSKIIEKKKTVFETNKNLHLKSKHPSSQ